MDLNQLHFANPAWLWAGLVIPFIWFLYFFACKIQNHTRKLENFIDSHLIPYLLVGQSIEKKSYWKPLLAWTMAWGLLTLALASPRWTFHEIETFSKDQSLVIVLDLSQSMNATDTKPSRLVRAKQKVEDIISQAKGVKIGLIAFAADPHMITPLTEDTETIRYLLPTVDTDLVYIQGSKLSPALEMALTMLNAEPGANKAIVVISDGGFEDAGAIKTAKQLAEKGIVIHSMGVGTPEGAPIQDHEGNVIKKNGTAVFSKLEKERFSEISKAGNGFYLDTFYHTNAEHVILENLEKRAEAQAALGKTDKVWEEHFYVLAIPLLPFFLWWFKRGKLFTFLFLFFLPSFSMNAFEPYLFKNSEQLGKEAYDSGDYEAASETFQDPYRKGVSCYRAGNFAEAESYFRESFRTNNTLNAGYNLGNALAQQQKYEEAIAAYEKVLEQEPEHVKAKDNLELIKKLLEQQKQDSSEPENSDSNQQKQEDSKEKNSQNKDDSKNSHSNPENKDSQDKDQSKEPSLDSKNKDKNDQSSEKENTPNDPNPPESNNQSEKDNQELSKSEKQQKERDGSSQELERDEKEEPKQANMEKSKKQEDHDADLWLNRISNDPKTFMKNKFYIESKKNGTTEGIDPW